MTAPYLAMLDDAAARLASEQIAVRRHLHRHPERSGEETETSKYLAERLLAAGLQPRVLNEGLGVAADVELGDPAPDAPCVALRGDIDALPIRDEKTVEYRSCVPGVMHACGHDGHAAIVLSAALVAAAVNSEWNKAGGPGVRLRFLFQPAEEDSRGAQWLIEQGLLRDVSAIFAIHMEPHFPLGHVGVRYGVLTAACDEIYISISGQGGHAARPHQTRDPVLAAAQLISSLYAILPRRFDIRSPAVLTIAQLQAGQAHNAIPERAEVRGTLRTIDPDTRQTMLDRIVDVCAGVSTMTGTTVSPEFRHAIPSVINDSRLSSLLERASTDVLGLDHVTRIEQPSLGGEDFAFYTQQLPGAMLRLGCTPPGATPHFLHSARFDIDERCMPLGTRILLRAAIAAADE